MELYINIFTAVFGLVIGSFLSVCAYRVPVRRLDRWFSEDEGEESVEILKRLRKDISIVSPARSFCPVCNHQLCWWENIPLFSWLILGGKCSSCKTPIPFRYPVLELFTAIIALLSIQVFGLTPTAVVVFGVCCTLIVITLIDYDYFIIPDVISIPGTIIGVIVAGINGFTHYLTPPIAENLLQSGTGVLFGAGFLWLIAKIYLLIRKREGLGMGDVKLLAMIGAFFGFEAVLFTIFMGSVLGSIVGVLLIIFAGRKFSNAIPFGPYLSVAAMIFIFTDYNLVIDFLVITGLVQN